MNDSQPGDLPREPATAGALLRQARVAKGLHIAALAASIKVAPRKLELLESDRLDELPGATFTRALAQTVCRSLKIDPVPVLALLPRQQDHALSQFSDGLNAPYRDKPGHLVPGEMPLLTSGMVLGAAALLLIGLAIYLVPSDWVTFFTRESASTEQIEEAGTTVPVPQLVPVETSSANSQASAPMESAAAASAPLPSAIEMPQAVASAVTASASEPVPVPVPKPVIAAAASVPLITATPATQTTQAAQTNSSRVTDAPLLLVRATAESWVEVIDARGRPVLSRRLEAGESVSVDGALPLRVKIGNASGTQVSFKGQAVDLMASRANVARLELK